MLAITNFRCFEGNENVIFTCFYSVFQKLGSLILEYAECYESQVLFTEQHYGAVNFVITVKTFGEFY